MASDLHLDVVPCGDGRVVLMLTVDAATLDRLRELLDRAAMPGQDGAIGTEAAR